MILIMQGQPGGRDRYMEGAWHGRGCAIRAVAILFQFKNSTTKANFGTECECFSKQVFWSKPV